VNASNRKRILLYIAGFCGYAASSIVFPIIAPYAKNLGASEAEAGMIAGGFALVTALTMIPLGLISDRYGKFRMVFIGMILFIVAPFFYVIASNSFELLLARFFHGFAMAAFVPASNAMVIDLSPEEKKGEALGWIAAFTMFGYALGPIFGGFFADRFGFNATFYSCSIFALIGLFSIIWLKGEKAEGRAIGKFDLDIFKRSGTWGALLTPFFATFGSAAIGIFAIPLYLPEFKIDLTVVGGVITLLFLSSAIVRVPAGKMADRFGRKPVIIAGLLIEALGIFLFLYPSFRIIIIGTVMIGAGMGIANPAGFALLSDIIHPRMRGFAMGASSTSLQVGVFMGPSIMGYVAEISDFRSVFIISGIFTLISTLIVLVLIRYESKD
jgi:MFS family permease